MTTSHYINIIIFLINCFNNFILLSSQQNMKLSHVLNHSSLKGIHYRTENIMLLEDLSAWKMYQKIG
jgi:hypothetical protein